MSPWLYLILLAALVAFGPPWIERVFAGKDNPEDTDAALAYFDRIRSLPETTAFDPPADVVRQRLHLVVPSNVVSIPRQREPYDVESEGL